MNKRGFFIFIFVVIAAITFFMAGAWRQKNITSKADTLLKINEAEINVELADSPQKRTQGLSDRDILSVNHGMLFIFENSDSHSFWMKDMNFAVDIIWIDAHKRIVDIAKNVLPESFPQTFKPQSPSRYVLEVNAGWVDKNRIHIGDSFTW